MACHRPLAAALLEQEARQRHLHQPVLIPLRMGLHEGAHGFVEVLWKFVHHGHVERGVIGNRCQGRGAWTAPSRHTPRPPSKSPCPSRLERHVGWIAVLGRLLGMIEEREPGVLTRPRRGVKRRVRFPRRASIRKGRALDGLPPPCGKHRPKPGKTNAMNRNKGHLSNADQSQPSTCQRRRVQKRPPDRPRLD